MNDQPVRLALSTHEARTAAAVFERLFPASAGEPGATDIGVVTYVDRALAGAYDDKLEVYRRGLAALDRGARDAYGAPFAGCVPAQQDALLAGLERGDLATCHTPPQQNFFALLLAHLQEGLFADPAYGGNRDKLGWKVLDHPGVWLENSAEENLSPKPVTKGGKIQALEDLGYILHGPETAAADIPCYDPQRGAL